MTKPTAGSAAFEVAFGAVLIVIGVLKPKFLWNWGYIQQLKTGFISDGLLGVLVVLMGVALIGWVVLRFVLGAPAPAKPPGR